MSLERLVKKALKAHPDVAQMNPLCGIAILFVDHTETVRALQIDLMPMMMRAMCEAVLETNKPNIVKIEIVP